MKQQNITTFDILTYKLQLMNSAYLLKITEIKKKTIGNTIRLKNHNIINIICRMNFITKLKKIKPSIKN